MMPLQNEMERDGYSTRSALTNLQGWVVPLDVNTNQFTECLLGGSYGGYLADSNKVLMARTLRNSIPKTLASVMFNSVILRFSRIISA